MKFGKTISNISVALSIFFCSAPLAFAQSAYTPIQFGHVHKPYGSDGDEQAPSLSPVSSTTSSSTSRSSSTSSPTYSKPAPNYSSTSTIAPSSSQSYATPMKQSTFTNNLPSTSVQPASDAPPQQSATQDAPPQTTAQDSSPQAEVQQRQVGKFLRGVSNALRNSGVVNNGSYVNRVPYVNTGGYVNNEASINTVAPIGAFARNFSGKPTLVNGVPYLGGALPSALPATQKVSISALKEDFPLPAGKDDLDTFDNKQLAQRANGGWIQRHYIVGTEGGGIIGRHGPQWHVGGQN